MKSRFLFALMLSAITAAIVISCQKEIYCDWCIVISNSPPVACAGDDQTISLPLDSVTLEGSCSTDPDNNIAAYTWTKIAGPASYNISNPNLPKVQVTGLVEGIFLFELKVTDTAGLFSRDTVQVSVITQTSNQPVDIYVAGDLDGQAAYWKNGQLVKLKSAINNSAATSIFVDGADVYVAGWEGDAFLYGGNIAKYWKNGQEVLLTGPTGAGANSLVVSGGDVYVAGWEFDGPKTVARYWKNNQPVTLTNGLADAEASCITVVDGNVYVSGYDNEVAKYWKNNQPVSLTAGSIQGFANSIAVVGNDVYVAGSESNGNVHVAKYWKNGHAVSLVNGSARHSTANSIAVAGSDVYVAGWEGDFVGMVGGTGAVGKYWKNGQVLALTNGRSYAYPWSIAIHNNDWYVAGTEFNGTYPVAATYWKNGSSSPVSFGNGSTARSIVVVPR